MARACDLSDARLWHEYESFITKELGKLISKPKSNFEFVQNGTRNEHFIIWREGYLAGFDRCADAANNPYPD